MKKSLCTTFSLLIVMVSFSCIHNKNTDQNMTSEIVEVSAGDIIGNPEYLAISYGGYRKNSRDIQPTIQELKEDLRILSAMGIKVIRTYNVHFAHAENVLEAIRQLKKETAEFEMYVMLGAWIDCDNAFTDAPNHNGESARNAIEIQKAVELTNEYSDIVKIIAVGNEAMVKWAASYFVQANVILKWVNHLQGLKKTGDLPTDLWITSSDNFASWGGGDGEYHTEDLEKLIKAVDYISVHTYPMHDTHYNPQFWGAPKNDGNLSKEESIHAAMADALDYAKGQYQNVVDYVQKIDESKPIHIGETGWASNSNGLYGNKGSRATDEYKEAIYYKLMRSWTNESSISCFYFEAFDENWKDGQNPGGSENHFGLFDINGQAKYALWDLVDKGVFEELGRGGQPIQKTYGGDIEKVLEDVMLPPIKK